MQYFLNVYQHTAAHPDRQRKLLHALSAIMLFLRPRATGITLMGDLNAALLLEREGYSTDMTRVDDMLTQWVRDEDFQRSDHSYDHTWRSPAGPQRAHLDYVLT
eukprot:3304945-Rhodomonas_salina.1